MNSVTHFTHYTVGHAHLGAYSSVVWVLFGAYYYVVPPGAWCCAQLQRRGDGVLDGVPRPRLVGSRRNCWQGRDIAGPPDAGLVESIAAAGEAGLKQNEADFVNYVADSHKFLQTYLNDKKANPE